MTYRTPQPSKVTVYVRHSASCPHKELESYPRCDCPKALRWSLAGKQHREAAGTRSWRQAEEKATAKQKQLDAGEAVTPTVTQTAQTIAAALETYLTAKRSEGLRSATLRKLVAQLGQFESFMAARSKFYPAEITAQDCVEFRASWTWPSGVTRQKAQQNVRGFLRSCCKENLSDLLAALKTIRLSKTDRTRLEPQPFTEDELTRLLEQVPQTFLTPDPRGPRMTALIHCMVSTGLSIRDTVQLERANLWDGWLRIDRQKTGKAVLQKLDGALCAELAAVANGNPQYIFWNGSSRPTSATGLWQADLRTLMKDAGLWIKGNLSHRFRDTAVDFWLGAGCSLTDVAAMLGDTVAVVERHYAKLASKRMEDRLATLPSRSWAAH